MPETMDDGGKTAREQDVVSDSHALATANLASGPSIWNGRVVQAAPMTAVVADEPSVASYWPRTLGLVGQRINVAAINSYGEFIVLDDRDGTGWAKVTTGEGPVSSPLTIVPGSLAAREYELHADARVPGTDVHDVQLIDAGTDRGIHPSEAARQLAESPVEIALANAKTALVTNRKAEDMTEAELEAATRPS